MAKGRQSRPVLKQDKKQGEARGGGGSHRSRLPRGRPPDPAGVRRGTRERRRVLPVPLQERRGQDDGEGGGEPAGGGAPRTTEEGGVEDSWMFRTRKRF